MSDPEWLKKYRKLNETLVGYGWFVPPFISAPDFQRLEFIIDRIQQNPPQMDKDRQKAEKEIYLVLCDVVFHPNFRARGVWYGLQLKHFREYSHIYESGIFAYFKREYMASVLCLLASLEGMLLSFCGWDMKSGRGKPNFLYPIQSVKGARAPSTCSLELMAGHDWFRDPNIWNAPSSWRGQPSFPAGSAICILD